MHDLRSALSRAIRSRASADLRRIPGLMYMRLVGLLGLDDAAGGSVSYFRGLNLVGTTGLPVGAALTGALATVW
jgi:hypothetical protein